MRIRTAAALVQMRALVELVRTRPKGGRFGGADANGEDKMSLSFLFFYSLDETLYADEGADLWTGPQPS